MKQIFATAAIAAMLAATPAAKADDKDRAEYKEFADGIRTAVYGMDLPAFDVREIPGKYKDESAVFVAIYHQVNAEKKTGFGRKEGSLMTFTRKAQVEGGNLTRMLIHINDKAALEKYSEFDFATDEKKKYWNAYTKSRKALGVRVIKPDGRITDVDTSDFIEVEEGKKGEKKSRKLAIPGLEIGDNIDVFFYTEQKFQNVHPDEITFYLRDDYPVMNYQIHCVIDDALATQYRAMNGAPDFKVSRDEDKNFVLDLEVTDISAKEPRLFYNARRQSPLINLHIFNRRGQQYTPLSAQRDGLQVNPEVSRIKEDRWGDGFNKLYMTTDLLIRDNLSNGNKVRKQIEKLYKSKQYSNTRLADYLYNLAIFATLTNNAYPGDYVTEFPWFFLANRKVKLPYGLTTDHRSHEPLDSLSYGRHAAFFVNEPDSGRYYLPWTGAIMAPSEIPPYYQGSKAQLYKDKKERKKLLKSDPDADNRYFTIPVSTPEQNRNVSDVNVTVDGTTLAITRTESHTGSTKLGAQWLLTEEDVIGGYLDYLQRDDIPVVLSDSKKAAAEREARYADARKQQAEDFKEEISDYHGQEASSMTDGRFTSIGIDPADPRMTYTVTYTMDNMVKRAGKNLIIPIGKLIGGQTEVLPGDRERNDDIEMISPREFVTRITIAYPQGYHASAKSLQALTRSIDNSTGRFDVTAEPSDDAVTVTVTKRYNHKSEPASAWPQLTDILDAASAWKSSTLLLER